jgi:hypothetical protein
MTFWSLKTSICKENCPINSKKVMKKFSHSRLPCKSLNFKVVGLPSKKSQTMETFLGQFSSKIMF